MGAVDQRYAGVTEGVVVAVNDPDGLGRVKVKLPWLDSQEVSDWCRVAQIYAGKGYGAFWLPFFVFVVGFLLFLALGVFAGRKITGG